MRTILTDSKNLARARIRQVVCMLGFFLVAGCSMVVGQAYQGSALPAEQVGILLTIHSREAFVDPANDYAKHDFVTIDRIDGNLNI